jgi:hypothetical protein
MHVFGNSSASNKLSAISDQLPQWHGIVTRREEYKRNLSGGFGSWPDGAIDTLPASAPRSAEIVFELQAHPDFGRGPQITRQAQGRVCRDAAPAADDVVRWP